MADSLRGGSTVGGYPIVTKAQIPFSFRESGGKLQYALDGVNFVNVEFTGDATAIAGNVLSGKTYYSSGNKVTGTMVNNDGVTFAAQSGGAVIETINDPAYSGVHALIKAPLISTGYATTSTKIVQRILNLNPANIKVGAVIGGNAAAGMTGTYTSDASAGTQHIYSGKTAYVNGSKLTGTMPVYTGGYATDSLTKSGNSLRMSVTNEGYHSDGAYMYYTENDWIEPNIKKGVNMFGKVGTLPESVCNSIFYEYGTKLSEYTWGYRVWYQDYISSITENSDHILLHAEGNHAGGTAYHSGIYFNTPVDVTNLKYIFVDVAANDPRYSGSSVKMYLKASSPIIAPDYYYSYFDVSVGVNGITAILEGQVEVDGGVGIMRSYCINVNNLTGNQYLHIINVATNSAEHNVKIYRVSGVAK